MITSLMKKIAVSYGLTIDKNFVYGEIGGFCVTGCDGYQEADFTFSVPFDSEADAAAMSAAVAAQKKQFKISRFQVNTKSLVVAFPTSIGVQKRIDAFLAWLPGALRHFRGHGTEICPLCFGPLESDGIYIFDEDYAKRVHPACMQRLASDRQHQARIAAEQYTLTSKGYGRGLVGALLFAGIGGAAFIGLWQLGYISAVAGILMGVLGTKGYEIFGGKPGKGHVWIVVLSVVAWVFLATWLAVVVEFAIAYNDFGVSVSFGYIASEISWYFQTDSEFQSSVIRNLVLAFIFSLVGCIGLFVGIHKGDKLPDGQVRVLQGRVPQVPPNQGQAYSQIQPAPEWQQVPQPQGQSYPQPQVPEYPQQPYSQSPQPQGQPYPQSPGQVPTHEPTVY